MVLRQGFASIDVRLKEFPFYVQGRFYASTRNFRHKSINELQALHGDMMLDARNLQYVASWPLRLHNKNHLPSPCTIDKVPGLTLLL